MKKVFSLILAVVMVASLASVAFAVDSADPDVNAYITSADAKNVKFAQGYDATLQYVKDRNFKDVKSGEKLIFGKEYYFPIVAHTDTSNTDVFSKVKYAISAKQIGSLKVTAEWKEGGEYVESVGIKSVYVENDFGATNSNLKRNVYAIYVKTTGESSDAESIVGTITVTGVPGAGTGKYDVGSKKVETKISFDETISNEVVDLVTTGSTLKDTTDVGTGCTIKDKKFTLTANAKTMKDVKFILPEVGDFEFDGDVTATLDSAAKKTLTISYNTTDVADVVAANPDAALMFYSIECNFKENAEVTIEPIDAEGTNYLYQILPSGAKKDLTSFYSVDDEQFIFNCRKLTGTYIVSDMPLVF